MSNWDPKEHPRDMRTGQFSETWIAAVDASLPKVAGDYYDSNVEYFRAMYRSRSFKHDMTQWDSWQYPSTIATADELLAKNLSDDDREVVESVRGQVSTAYEEYLNIPPWEGGQIDDLEIAERFQEQWVRGVHEYLAKAGIDPIKFETMAEQYDGSTSDAYADFAADYPHEYAIHIVSETIDAMGPGGMAGEAQRAWLSELNNAAGFFERETMPSYDHPEAREFKAHHLAEHAGFTTKGWFEILTPDGEWNILEDVAHDEDQEEVTIWAGDHHYIIDATDDVTVRAPSMPELADIYVEGG